MCPVKLHTCTRMLEWEACGKNGECFYRGLGAGRIQGKFTFRCLDGHTEMVAITREDRNCPFCGINRDIHAVEDAD